MNYKILPPAYTIENKDYFLIQEKDNVFSDKFLRVKQTESEPENNIIRLTRTWSNISDQPVEFQCVLYVKTDFIPTHYVIPSVSYNGNNFGSDNEPKGLSHDGKPWVFSYERTSIPSCTISENERAFLSLFASDSSKESLVSSCSLIENADKTFSHAIWYPNIERPLSYTAKNAYTKNYEPKITLAPGKTVSFDAYIVTGVPYCKNFASANVQDIAIKYLKYTAELPENPEEIKNASFSFVDDLTTKIKEGTVLSIGFSPDENNSFTKQNHFEIGWCGQNAMFARLMLEEYAENGDKHKLDTAVSILDTWLKARLNNGLMYICFESIGSSSHISDMCNLGYAAAEYTKCFRIAESLGLSKPEWLDTAVGICSFMIKNYSDSCGFGKAVDALTGDFVDTKGTVGAFIIPALLETYKETKNEEYLLCAKKAFRFYLTRDLDNFICTSGALDSDCIDKETSYALIISGLTLYEITEDKEFLTGAVKASYYFCSWMFHYNVLYPDDSEFTRYGWSTCGGTSVSVTHHHMDPWGAFCFEPFLRLEQYTGDSTWRKRAEMMLSNALKLVTLDKNRKIHSMKRPLGSQNEAYFHCRWFWDKNKEPTPGTMNDWLVSWPCAFRICALQKLIQKRKENKL